VAEFLIVIVIIAILVALGFGLIGMVKGGRQGSDKMFKSSFKLLKER
jgi:type II secretory pathway pseudopilin PulG